MQTARPIRPDWLRKVAIGRSGRFGNRRARSNQPESAPRASVTRSSKAAAKTARATGEVANPRPDAVGVISPSRRGRL